MGFTCIDFESITFGSRSQCAARCGSFQRDRGLALEGHLRGQPEDGSNGIEQPATGGCFDGLNLPDSIVSTRSICFCAYRGKASSSAERVARKCRADSSTPCARADGRLHRRRAAGRSANARGARSRRNRDQKFAAPDLAIGAISGAIERYADHLVREMVLRHATGDVRMVMLHADLVLHLEASANRVLMYPGCRSCATARGVTRKSCLIWSSVSSKNSMRLVVFQIADVLAENGIVALREAERALQLATERQISSNSIPRSMVLRRISARAAQHALAAFERADHGIVHTRLDVTVVDQKPVGDAAKSAHASSFAIDDWLLAEVAAGHHQRVNSEACRRIAEQQVVQRRVGQHHAQSVVAGRDGRYNAVSAPAVAE